MNTVGRFSLRGTELGWAKAWYLNLGMINKLSVLSVLHKMLDALSAFGLGVDNKAKIKFRAGLNLNTLKAYVRVRVRTEPINSFNIAEGIHIFGKVLIYRMFVCLKILCFLASFNAKSPSSSGVSKSYSDSSLTSDV